MALKKHSIEQLVASMQMQTRCCERLLLEGHLVWVPEVEYGVTKAKAKMQIVRQVEVAA
jgi:hypothetical protein